MEPYTPTECRHGRLRTTHRWHRCYELEWWGGFCCHYEDVKLHRRRDRSYDQLQRHVHSHATNDWSRGWSGVLHQEHWDRGYHRFVFCEHRLRNITQPFHARSKRYRAVGWNAILDLLMATFSGRFYLSVVTP